LWGVLGYVHACVSIDVHSRVHGVVHILLQKQGEKW